MASIERKFSVALNSTDLNDFITPSQTCIKPPLSDTNNNPSITNMDIKLSYDEYGENSGFVDKRETPLQPVQINLSDCLACSGCITSAESILVNRQQPSELYEILENKGETKIVVSISNQVLASFAAKYSTSCDDISGKICGFLKLLGIHYVLNLDFSSDLALVLSCNEFIQNQCLLLASSCPGWICYAEKVHSHMLPYISKVKSPQQIAGALVKRFICRELGLDSTTPHQIYHVTIMSCYDKKLEASRSDFYDEILGTSDVDCVLTSGELESMILKSGYNIVELNSAQLDTHKIFRDIHNNSIPFDQDSGSGGYLVFIMSKIVSLFATDEYQVEITERGKDYKEYQVIHKRSNAALYIFIFCYGFKNIQNLLRRVKAKPSIPTFVEVMACPSGCLNGGGQLTNNECSTRIGSREFLRMTESSYHSLNARNPESNSHLEILENWFGKDFLSSEEFKKCVYTSYHPVEKTYERVSTQW